MEKHPSSKMMVRFQDCDPFSHLNNGRYLDYFMNAREDHLLQYYNIDIYERFKKTGRSWVVAKNEILYRKPVFLREVLIFRSKVINFSSKHLQVEMTMWDEGEKELKSILRGVFIPFDGRTNKVVEHQDEIMDLLKSVHMPDAEPTIEEAAAKIESSLNQ